MDLRGRALRMLALRERTRAELQHKLAGLGTQEEIDAVLDELERSGWLSDSRVAEAFVTARSRRFGDRKLRHELRARGVAEALIETTLQTSAGSELERARAVWRRKFAAAPADATEYARQARFLQARGFAVEVIRKLLREPDE